MNRQLKYINKYTGLFVFFINLVLNFGAFSQEPEKTKNKNTIERLTDFSDKIQNTVNEKTAKLKNPESLMKGQTSETEDDNDKYLGSWTLRISGGLYNFNTRYENKDTGESREYFLEVPHLFWGFEIAARVGENKDKYHFQGNDGFAYYRSNTGFFIDMELGAKSYMAPPISYSYKSTKNGILTNGTVDLEKENFFYLEQCRPFLPLETVNDGISCDVRDAAGGKASKAVLAYFNSYFHMTPINLLLNFGSAFKWYDLSIGPSLRVAQYGDYSDPESLQNKLNDGTMATVSLALRQYIEFHKKVRLRAHYFWPFYAQIARFAKDGSTNEEEHILDAALDIYVHKYIYISLGYEYHYWKINPTGDYVENLFRQGLKLQDRTSQEFYLAISLDIASAK